MELLTRRPSVALCFVPREKIRSYSTGLTVSNNRCVRLQSASKGSTKNPTSFHVFDPDHSDTVEIETSQMATQAQLETAVGLQAIQGGDLPVTQVTVVAIDLSGSMSSPAFPGDAKSGITCEVVLVEFADRISAYGYPHEIASWRSGTTSRPCLQ